MQGCEYKARNPTRDDGSVGSFSINTNTGVWSDFATGDGGRDAISLWAYCRNLKQGEAAKQLAEAIGHRQGEPQSRPSGEWVLVSTVPANAPALPTERRIKTDAGWAAYPITHYWPYHDRLGNVVGYVVRYETPTGKATPAITLHRCGDALKWKFKGFPPPRHIYNLHKLCHSQNPRVVVVEGEKCAEILRATLAHLGVVVTTWAGGTNGVKYADFEPLILAKQVLLWPDNAISQAMDRLGKPKFKPDGAPLDKDPGYDTMLRVAAYIRIHAPDMPIKIVRKQADRQDGWDCADAILAESWDAQRCLAFMREQSEELPEDLPDVERTVGSEAETIPAPTLELAGTDPAPGLPIEAAAPGDNGHYRSLGYFGTDHYFYPHTTRQIIRISAPALGKKNYLYSLAPLHYWERAFGGDRGVHWDMAQNSILRESERAGIFSEERMRGRGAWEDRGNHVVNLGGGLLVNGEPVDYSDFKTAYIYEAGNRLEFNRAEPLPDRAGEALLDICGDLFWERKIYATVLAGWCVIAPICGGLRMRPHLWLTGGAGTGKTEIIRHIVQPLLGEMSLTAQSSTTEAAIRQTLNRDALPVLIDEFESDGDEDRQRIKKILELSRGSFSGDTPIRKGGQNGRAQSFLVRSSFFMSSINVNISNLADKTRISVLRLKKPHNRDGMSPKEQWAALLEKITTTLTPEWCAALRARTISLIGTINANSRIFGDAVGEHLGSARLGDQIGPILAGTYSLRSSGIVSRDVAQKWASEQPWDDQNEVNSASESDERQCLRTIFSASIRTPRGDTCLCEVLGEIMEENELSLSTADANKKMLAIYGCKLSLDKQTVFVAKDQTQIQRLLERTPWRNSYYEMIKRLAGEPKTSAQRIMGILRQCVCVPVTAIFD